MTQQINLFNPLFASKKAYFLAGTMVKGLGGVLAGCVLLAVYLQYEVGTLAKNAAAANAQLAMAETQLQTAKTQYASKKESVALEEQVQRTEQELQSLRNVLEVLRKGDIGNTDGYSSYMHAFARQSMDGIWLTGFNIVGAGKEIELQGQTIKPDLLPVYINRLKDEPVMQGKTFGTLEMQIPEAKIEKASKPEPGNGSAYIEFKLN